MSAILGLTTPVVNVTSSIRETSNLTRSFQTTCLPVRMYHVSSLRCAPGKKSTVEGDAQNHSSSVQGPSDKNIPDKDDPKDHSDVSASDEYYKNYSKIFSEFDTHRDAEAEVVDKEKSYFAKYSDTFTQKFTQDDMPLKLTHTDCNGRAVMVDVDHKPESSRVAVARATVYLGDEAFSLVKENKMKKGDVLTVAQLAGIMGAKQTSNLIPLCHNLPIKKVKVDLHLDEGRNAVVVESHVKTFGQTGVEMEALTAVSIAALTVYDMCKAVTHDIVISDVMLVSKTGGQRGDFHR
ncbi:molybdenum cofactor biosynthesis protein 1-like [Lineus longissimus]|uniref:molybdenum cofactor biosynthesis protein 1-like n=1 Tax=Lineus longissimus TaxID=88925 RepID=UPI00315C915D